MTPKKILYADLLDMSSPAAVLDEVRHIVGLIDRGIELSPLERAFEDVCALYRGDYPGYRGCNTYYHDLRHTTDVFLALARLLHGAHAAGERFAPSAITLSLVAALFHDCGYIQTEDDREGTGGKYTLIHVQRSIDFMQTYFRRNGFADGDFEICRNMVLCTSVSTPVATIPFPSPSLALLGKMVGTADFLGQVSDRLYLEKLLFLYREFHEAQIPGYSNELELLRKTIAYYDFILKRLEVDLDDVQRFMSEHFRGRWRIEGDLYREAVDTNISYLDGLMQAHQHDYRNNLKREGVVARLMALEAAEQGRANP